MNDLDVHDGGSGATGGARKYPLPYPFGHIGALAAAGTKQLPMHPSDWRYKSVPWVPFEPKDQWNGLVAAGKVTLAVAAEANRTDNEELFIDLI
jgi:hypothetical protein